MIFLNLCSSKIFLDNNKIKNNFVINNKFKKMNVDVRTVDPFRFLSDYPNIKVDYLYGKYDTEYMGFMKYIEQFNHKNLSIKEIDYKISESQRHNIRPYVDRKLLKNYIDNLPTS